MSDLGRKYVFDLEAKLQSAEAELARLREALGGVLYRAKDLAEAEERARQALEGSE